MIPATDNYLNAQNPEIGDVMPVVITIEGYDRVFTNYDSEIDGQYPWIVSIDDFDYSVNDMDGGADTGNLCFTVQDNAGLITADFPNFIFEGKKVTVKIGLPSLEQDDFITIFSGFVDTVASANGNAEYYFMLKMFQSYQQLWIDAYRDIFSIVLEEDIDEDPAVIDIDLPPILADDLQKLAMFIQTMSSVFPELKVPEVLKMCLISLGVNNIDEVMKSIEAKRVDIDDRQEKIIAAAAVNAQNNPAATGAPNPALPVPSVPDPKAVQEALDRLSKVMQEVLV